MTMDQTELRMNLAAVKRTDPYAQEIVETSAHVAFYTFNHEDNEWEKTDVEGAFFVYRRTAEPFHSIFINNRLNTDSLVEPITADLELQAQPPFLLYRNERSRIRGFWFYNKDELERVATLVNRLGRECQKRQQQQQQQSGPPQPPAQAQPLANFIMGNNNNNNNNINNNNNHPFKGINGGGGGGVMDGGEKGNVNIFSMLSKAQEDFYKSNNPGKLMLHPQSGVPQQQQQQQQNHYGPALADGGSVLAALLPKMNMNNGGNGGNGGKDGVTSQSVMNFFAAAKPPQQQQINVHPHPHPHQPQVVLHSNGHVIPNGAGGAGGNGSGPAQQAPPPPLLQRLMSNPVHTTVEQIEMQHRAVTPQEAVAQQVEAQQKQGPAKENGFNWKTKQTVAATVAAVPHSAAGAGALVTNSTTTTTSGDAAKPKGDGAGKNGGQENEMWPALFQQNNNNKGGGGAGIKGQGAAGNKANSVVVVAESSSVAAVEKTPTNAVNRKGQNKNAQAGGGASTAAAASAAAKPALMTPTMFKKTTTTSELPLSKVDPTNPSLIATGAKRELGVAAGVAGAAAATAVAMKSANARASVDASMKPEPLTQSQMLQAMTHLMKTDAEFMRKLHEAYVKSFAEKMTMAQ